MLSDEQIAEGKRLLEIWESDSEDPAPVVQWRHLSGWFVNHGQVLLSAASRVAELERECERLKAESKARADDYREWPRDEPAAEGNA